ncbi:MAG: hypothetical protein ACREBG_30170 [Pyrinomonadaceae bacterium]
MRLRNERRSAACGMRDKKNRNDVDWLMGGPRAQIGRQLASAYGGRTREIYRLTLATLMSLRGYV